MNNISRRSKVYLFSPAEKAIYDALQLIESIGADPRLTAASVLLSQAREKLADYIDEQIELSK
jgi:hypothetical protein